MNVQTITIGMHTVGYRVIQNNTDSHRASITISPEKWEKDPEAALREELTQHFPLWHLREEFRDAQIRERFRFTAPNHRTVGIYNFGEPLTSEQRVRIRRALSLIAAMVRYQHHWKLHSLLICGKDVAMNPHSGLPYRGHANYDQAFALFPFVLDLSRPADEDMAKVMPRGISELEFTIVHECGHLMVEPLMCSNWTEQMNWVWTRHYPQYDVQRADGTHPESVCLTPEECPRNYSTAAQSEDIADSVATFAYLPEALRGARRALLEPILRSLSERPPLGELRRCEPQIPQFPAVNICIDDTASFKPVATKKPTEPSPREVISVEDFRRGVQEGNITQPPPFGLTLLSELITVAAEQL